MNFKKYISGASALAIAASAFAAMAVTANADGATEVDYIGSSTVVESNPSTTGWTNVSAGNVTEVAKPEIGGYATSDGNKYDQSTNTKVFPTYVSGTTVRNSQKKSTVTSTYAIPQRVTNGTVTFKANVTTSSDNAGYYDGGQIYLADSTGTSVLKVAVPNGTKYATINGSNAFYVAAREGATGFYIELTVDLDAHTYTAYYDYVDNNRVRKTGSNNGTISSDIENIASLNLYQSSTRSSNNTYLHIDDIQFYANTVVATTANYTVNYELSGTTVRTETLSGEIDSVPEPDTAAFLVGDQKYYCVSNDASGLEITSDGSTVVTVNVREADVYSVNVVASTGLEIVAATNVVEGESLSYVYPRYYVNVQGKLVACDESSFRASVTPSDDTTVTIPYTVQDVTFQFVEMSDTTAPAAYPERLSNGMFQNVGETETSVMTVAADGIYTLQFTMGSTRSASTGNTLTIKVNGTDLATQETTASSPIKTVQNVELHAGDVISAVGNNSRICLDYVLITKTADLVATQADMAFTFDSTIAELGSKNIVVHRTADSQTATLNAADLTADEGTAFIGEGDVKLAIIFTNIPADWGTLSITLE